MTTQNIIGKLYVGTAVRDLDGAKGWITEFFSHQGRQMAAVQFRGPFMLVDRVRPITQLRAIDPHEHIIAHWGIAP